MDNIKAKPVLLFISLCIYNYLFWHENIGINLPLFSLLILAFCFYFYPEARRSKPAITSVLITIFSGIMVILHNTSLSVCIHVISFFISIGFLHAASVKSIQYSLLQIFKSYLLVPETLKNRLKRTGKKHNKIGIIWKFTQRSIIPLAVFIIFYIIYRQANEVFAKFSDIALNNIFDFLAKFFNFSPVQVLFLIMGIFIITGALFRQIFNDIILSERQQNDTLIRTKNKTSYIISVPQYFYNKSLGLKSEFRTATWLLILLNILLFAVNMIDIIWVWFGFTYSIDFNYKQSVHEGTYLLIFSILLSTAILLFFFRGNLNFYKNNIFLKRLAYIWIAQNMILATSVAIRTWHYISFQGLAYKRLGVLVFLLLTFIGLATLFIKIYKRKSAFYLWRINLWTAYFVLAIFCAVHWDMVIVNYNLAHKNDTGIADFYLEISDHTLPELYENLDIVAGQIQTHPQYSYSYSHVSSMEDFRHRLNLKAQQYLYEHSTESWPSWNIADAKTLKYLKLHSEEI